MGGLAGLPASVAAVAGTPEAVVGVCAPGCSVWAAPLLLLLLPPLLRRVLPRLVLLPRHWAVWGTAGLLLLPTAGPVALLLLLWLVRPVAWLLLLLWPVLPAIAAWLPVTGPRLGWGGRGLGHEPVLQQVTNAGIDTSLDGSSQLLRGHRGVGSCLGLLPLLLQLFLVEGEGLSGDSSLTSIFSWSSTLICHVCVTSRCCSCSCWVGNGRCDSSSACCCCCCCQGLSCDAEGLLTLLSLQLLLCAAFYCCQQCGLTQGIAITQLVVDCRHVDLQELLELCEDLQN